MKPDLNSASLDALLAAEDQQRVRATVRALGEDVPSMAWRSQLNERILAEATSKRRSRQRLWWIFTPSVGVAVAGALAFAVLLHTPRHSSQTGVSLAPVPSLEASLVGAASDNAVSDEVTGSGLHVRDLTGDQGADAGLLKGASGSSDDADSEDTSDL